jgi:hypothetical protein
MIEILGGGVFGAILGGLFRLAPEVIKFFDKKDERQHELAMFERQCELEKVKGDQKLAEIGAQHEATVDAGVLQALNGIINQQTELAKAAGGWVAALSASVRPIVTYWVLALWSFIHVWYAWEAWSLGLPPTDVFKAMMTADFAALVSGTINYWFLDRTLAKRGL